MAVQEEAPAAKYLGKFIFTTKTATFRSMTLQLSNVVKIEVESYQKIKKAVYRISDENQIQAWKALGLGVLFAFLSQYVSVLGIIGALLIFIGGGIIWYHYDERNRKKDIARDFFGLRFYCASGTTEVLWFDRQADVVNLFDRITNSMNHENAPNFIANFTDNRIEIRDSENVIIDSTIDAAGNVVVGNRSY
jgi:hypothetical protein